jgi:hypothetical protein
MDSIGDKLSMLIEQAKRALGTEVVVMSDAKEDEVDDGSPGWEEEDNDQPRTLSRSGSLKHLKRPRSILPPPPPSSSFNIPTIPHASTSSPKRSICDSAPPNSFAPSSAPGSANYITTPRKTHSRCISYESGVGLGLGLDSPSFVEDPSTWESPEIREGMEKARSRYLGRIGRTC